MKRNSPNNSTGVDFGSLVERELENDPRFPNELKKIVIERARGMRVRKVGDTDPGSFS